MIRPQDEIIYELVSTGLTHHQTTLLVQLLASRDASRDERDDGRDGRAMSAERSSRYRARIKNKSGMAGQTDADGASRQTSRDGRDAERDGALILASLPLKVEATEEASKEERKKERARNKRKPAVPLPDDWVPSQSHYDAARSLGCPEGFVGSKATDMRIWAQSNDARKVNWDMTFHGFLRRDSGATHAKTRGNIIPAQEQLIGKLADFNRPAPRTERAIRSGEGAAPVRLLSKG